jgi:hypothetical protein
MKKLGAKILIFTVFLIIGGSLGYALGSLLKGGSSAPKIPTLWLLSLLPILVGGVILGILLHELGHALAGYLMGFKFRFLTAGPFMWEKEGNGRIIFKWNKSLNTSGGLTLCLPDKTENVRFKFVWYGAGGPLMSLFTAIIFWLISNYLTSSSENFWFFFIDYSCFILSILSFGFFLLTIIPFYTGGFYTDGARILSLLRNNNESKIQVVLLSEMSRSIAGVRPRDLNENALMEILPLSQNPPFTFSIINYLYFIALDKKEIDLAAERLNQLTQICMQLPLLFSRLIYLEKAYFEAFFGQNVAEAQYAFNQVGTKNDAFIPKALYFKAESIIALSQQNFDLAIEKAKLALTEIPNLLEKGQMPMQTEQIEEIISTAKEKKMIMAN